MGSKRFRKDGFFRGDRYPGRHPSNEYGIHPKKIKPTAPLTPHNAKIAAINPLKSKIRDLSRVLEHADHLPPGVRIEKERALAGYRMDLENAEEEKRTKEMIGRYHMVRFFERQKATRHLKKAKKRLSSTQPSTPDHTTALQDVHIAEVDLSYTQYCPLNAKYEAIYPREQAQEPGKLVARENGNGGEAETALASRPPMWRIVENCMREGTLDLLRDGKMFREVAVGRTKPTAKKHARGPGGGVMIDGDREGTEKREKGDEMDDGESDGGFFEE